MMDSQKIDVPIVQYANATLSSSPRWPTPSAPPHDEDSSFPSIRSLISPGKERDCEICLERVIGYKYVNMCQHGHRIHIVCCNRYRQQVLEWCSSSARNRGFDKETIFDTTGLSCLRCYLDFVRRENMIRENAATKVKYSPTVKIRSKKVYRILVELAKRKELSKWGDYSHYAIPPTAQEDIGKSDEISFLNDETPFSYQEDIKPLFSFNRIDIKTLVSEGFNVVDLYHLLDIDSLDVIYSDLCKSSKQLFMEVFSMADCEKLFSLYKCDWNTLAIRYKIKPADIINCESLDFATMRKLRLDVVSLFFIGFDKVDVDSLLSVKDITLVEFYQMTGLLKWRSLEYLLFPNQQLLETCM